MINLRSIITFFCIFASSITLAQIKILDRIVAIVDDDVVLQSELNQRMISIIDQISQSTTSVPPENIIKQQVLERLISERIQLTMGYNAGVRISDDELNQAIGRTWVESFQKGRIDCKRRNKTRTHNNAGSASKRYEADKNI